MNKKYSVTGMTCAACSSGIERTVSKLDGVSSCSVSLMGESMDVTFDESKLSDGDIRAAVTSLGYGAFDYGKAPAKSRRASRSNCAFSCRSCCSSPKCISRWVT